MDLNIWTAFIFACLIFSSAPGAGILFTVNNSITKNTGYTAVAIAGLEAALLVYLLFVALGIGVLISGSLIIFSIIKWFGALYLFWLGLQKFLHPVKYSGYQEYQADYNYRKAFISGMCVNLSNPKSIIFLAALLPQFIDISRPQAKQYIILCATMIIIDIFFHSTYGFFGQSLRQLLLKKRWSSVINKVFGLLFIGAGFLIAITNR